MKYSFAGDHYKSIYVSNDQEGFAGLELHRISGNQSRCVARVIFWDATGQYFVETCGAEITLQLLERLIAETKAAVPAR
jgi:hypothetical protein